MTLLTDKPGRGASIIGDFRRGARNHLRFLDGARWPMVRYQKDPVGFVREQLGEKPMAHQRKIMRACAASRRSRVAVRSGQKTGKTKLVIWLALWFYCCFPESKVYLTASTAPQVERVLWAELKGTLLTAKRRRGLVLPEEPAQNPERGLQSEDGRAVRGFTTRTIESMAGLSGKNMLFIGDEASSFEREMAEAIRGNTAGDARVIWISNPTRAEGPFYDCFFSKKKFWKRFHLSSEVLAKRMAKLKKRIPGVASIATIEDWKSEYGEDSPFYIVRAKGDFLLDEQAKCVSLHNILAAQERWEEAVGEGRLRIGVDPAGDKDEGDEWSFSIVRGKKLLALYTFRALSEDAGLAQLTGLLAEFRRGDEIPVVMIDAEGPIGSAYYGRARGLALHLQIHNPPLSYEVYGIKGSSPAQRSPELYERRRDELWSALSIWMKDGAIPKDHKLEEEIYAPGFLVTVQGKRKVTHKDVLREKLGRSPDRADSLCLAVWEPSAWMIEDRAVLPNAPQNVGPGSDDGSDGGEDPYAGGRAFDPYRS